MSQLTLIAADMERRAIRRGVALVDLSRGLRLQLVICGGQRILSLSRPAVLPSIDEIALCRAAFHVPPDASPAMTNTEVTYRWIPS